MENSSRLGMYLWAALIFCVGLICVLTSHNVVQPFETALHEVGFAFLVSVVLWGIFEHHLSREAEHTWDRRVERVTKNVFQAVLRKDLPKGLLDEANNLVLNTSLIRSGFTVTYTLIDATFENLDGPPDCVLVEAVMEFGMKNIGTDTVCWPVALGLPNPIHQDLKRQVKVSSLSVTKGGEPVHFEMDDAQRIFRERLDSSDTMITFSAGVVELQPGEQCQFSATYVMAKEPEDSEFVRTLYPADGMRVTIFDKATDGRRITLATPVHRKDLDHVTGENGDPHSKIFRITHYLLPHQGVLIWWKRRPAERQRTLPIE